LAKTKQKKKRKQKKRKRKTKQKEKKKDLITKYERIFNLASKKNNKIKKSQKKLIKSK